MQQTWETILVICSGIVCIGGALGYISKLRKPIKDMQDMIKDHNSRIEKIEERLSKNDDAVMVQNKCLLALISHAINGNSIDKLKEAKASLEDYLLKR